MGLKRNHDFAASAAAPATAADAASLLAQLDAADAGLRRAAARALATQAEATAPLCERLLLEDDASVRAALFTSIGRLGGRRAVDGLLPLLRSEDAGLRNGAIEVLSGLPDAVAPSMEALLADADGDVRIFAVNLLTDLPHPGVPGWLAQVLQREPAVNVVGAALEVTAEVGDASMLPALAAARARFASEPFIAFAADLACARIEAA